MGLLVKHNFLHSSDFQIALKLYLQSQKRMP